MNKAKKTEKEGNRKKTEKIGHSEDFSYLSKNKKGEYNKLP